MADLVEGAGPLVPAGIAARMWHHSKRGQLGTENQRLFNALHLEMARCCAEASTRYWTAETTFTVPIRRCRTCGGPFLGAARQLCCSISCGGLLDRVKMKELEGAMRQDVQMGEQQWVPELQALNLIVRGLRMLPDQAARQRALEYAASLAAQPVEAVAPRLGGNGEAHDSAPT